MPFKTIEEQRAYWRQQRRIYRLRHPERLAEQKRKSDKRNPESVLRRRKRWQENNRAKCRLACRNHYYRNREKVLARCARYERANRDKINARRQRQRQNDVHYRIKKNIQRKIGLALSRSAGTKSGKTMEVVGCDTGFLKRYLETRFERDMSWSNYGDWHIDHRIPCDKFDLRLPEQQRQCFHYSNLQPLWKSDNLSKGRKLPPIHQAELL